MITKNKPTSILQKLKAAGVDLEYSEQLPLHRAVNLHNLHYQREKALFRVSHGSRGVEKTAQDSYDSL